eukprot:TRINITY_DN1546_c0_g1_i1.p1 TRINITY_DN1546_c0_g1~~TRINITY_DN1546_c0_g1_i1.p1  ORF type:complete len:241 (+),score=89.86 TRINITY_DN1546_c0_g1_i1:46-768(+)
MSVYRDTKVAPERDTYRGGATGGAPFGGGLAQDYGDVLAGHQYAVGLAVLALLWLLMHWRGGVGREEGELELRLSRKRLIQQGKQLGQQAERLVNAAGKHHGTGGGDVYSTVESKLRDAAALEAKAGYCKSLADKLQVLISGLRVSSDMKHASMPELVNACKANDLDRIAAALDTFDSRVLVLPPTEERVEAAYLRKLDAWCDDEEFEEQLAAMPRAGKPLPGAKPVREGSTIRDRLRKK